MPIYEVTAPNGKIYEIEGPAGASQQELIQTTQRYIRQQEAAAAQARLSAAQAALAQAQTEPPKTTAFGQAKEFVKGVIPGAIGLAETAATGISALLPEETEKAARDKIREIAGVAKAPFAAAPGYEESVARRLSEGIGSTVPFFLLGPLGLAGRVAAGGIGVAAGAGEAREAAEAKGATPEERRLATQLGAPTGLLDLLAPNIGPIKNIITTALARGGVEGATEAAQKVSQNLIAKGVYDPSQPIFAGAGEEGAYGAGVGALTSLILDLAIPGRRAAYRPKPEPTPTPTPTPEAQKLLAAPTAEPFTPVAAPDGSVFTRREDYERFIAEQSRAQRERAEDIRTTEETFRGALTPEQMALARTGKQAALQETFDQGQAYPPGPLFPEEPTLYGPRTEEEFQLTPPERDVQAERQLELPLEAAAEPARQDIRQPDLIEIAETQQLEDLLRAEEAAKVRAEKIIPVVGARNEAEIARVKTQREQAQTAQAAAKEQQRLKFESDLAELSGRLETTQQKTTEDKRLQILLPIIEDPTVTNIPRAFTRALRAQGYTDLGFSPRERSLIQRAVDFKLATPVTPETAPSAPADLTAMEAAIPEKKEERIPQQPSFPGMGKKGLAPAPVPEPVAAEPAAPTLLSPEVLDRTGLPKQSGFYKQLVGKDMTDPEQSAQIQDVFARVQDNPRLSAATKEAISALEGQRFRALAQQQEMFGPRGGVLPTAVPKKGKQVEPTGVVPRGVGVSPAVSVPAGERAKPAQPRPAAAPAAKAPKRDRLAVRKEPARPAVSRKEPKPSALEEPKAKPVPSISKQEARNRLRQAGYDPQEAAQLIKDNTDSTTGEVDAQAINEATSSFSKLNKDEVKLVQPLGDDVIAQLKTNDVSGALDTLAKQTQGELGRIARALSRELRRAKIEVIMADFKKPPPLIERLFEREPDSKDASGFYATSSAGKRYLVLDTNTGLDAWTLMHESTHAATDATLNNESHPMTVQLTKLYKEVEPLLGTVYGARDVKEFASEAFSNKSFRQQLAAISIDKKPVNALQRFVNIVSNYVRRLLGKPAKTPESALDVADNLINKIIATNHGDAGVGSLYRASFLNKGDQVIDLLAERMTKLPGLTPERVGTFHEFFAQRAPNTVKDLVRSALPLNALTDVAAKYIPMAPKVDELVNLKSGAESKLRESIEPIVKRAQTWAAKNSDKVDGFNEVIYASTLYQVDPSKPKSVYDGKVDSDGIDKGKEWDKLQANWRAVGSEGQALYKQMRETYAALYERIKDVIGSRIDSAVPDAAQAKKIKNDIYQRLAKQGRIEPYFPLTRTGNYWLSYTAVDPRTGNKEFFVEAYESDFLRTQAIKELQADKGADASDFSKFASINRSVYKKAPSTSFVNNVLKTLDSNQVDPEVTEEIMRLFLNNLPETSFAQSFRNRKNRLGFERDAIRALQSKTFSLARQLTNMEYAVKFSALRQEMEEHVRKSQDAQGIAFYEELGKRIDFAISPDVPNWAKVATSFNFAMTLGANVSSALLNMSQVPLIVLPYFGGRYGYSETTKAIGRATKYFTNSGLSRDIDMLVPTEGKTGEKKTKVRAFLSIDNYDFADPKNKDLKHLAALVKVAGDRGQLNRSMIYDILDVDTAPNILTKINAVSGFAFHQAERMNRQIALVSAYELELQKLVGKGKPLTSATEEQQTQAAHKAIYLTELTNGGVAAGSAPRIAQSGIGKVAFMYKRYGVSMYYLLFKTARDITQGLDPELRKQAMRQMAGIYASSALLAGAQGLPLFGIAAMAYNLFTEDDEDDFETAARKWLGETYYSGLGNALLGVQVSSRIGLSDLIFRESMSPADKGTLYMLMEQLGGPLFGILSRMERGLTLIDDGYGARGVEQLMPAAISSIMKAGRFGAEGTTTLRGDPITGEVSYWNVAAQALGFAPADYIRQMEENAAKNKIIRGLGEARTKLYQRYFMALKLGDSDGAADVLADIIKFNERHPLYAITPEGIMSSVKERMRRSAETEKGVFTPKGMRAEIARLTADFNGEDEED